MNVWKLIVGSGTKVTEENWTLNTKHVYIFTKCAVTKRRSIFKNKFWTDEVQIVCRRCVSTRLSPLIQKSCISVTFKLFLFCLKVADMIERYTFDISVIFLWSHFDIECLSIGETRRWLKSDWDPLWDWLRIMEVDFWTRNQTNNRKQWVSATWKTWVTEFTQKFTLNCIFR